MSVDNTILNMFTLMHPIDNPTNEFNSGFEHEGLIEFTETATKVGSDEIKYILKKDANWFYHDGANWVVSNETFAQSNTAVEITANKATFTTTAVQTFIRAFLHSDDGSTTPELENVLVCFNFAGSVPDTIDRIAVVAGLY